LGQCRQKQIWRLDSNVPFKIEDAQFDRLFAVARDHLGSVSNDIDSIDRRAGFRALRGKPIAAGLVSQAVARWRPLSLGKSAESIHDNVASFGATLVIFACHYGIGAKRKCEALPLFQDRSKYFALYFEQVMRVVRQSRRQYEPAPIILLAPKEISIAMCSIGKGSPNEPRRGARLAFALSGRAQ